MSVLVVDDQPLNRLLLGKLLRSLDPHVHVIEACDGQAGLEAYLQYGRSVAMVFMDLMMPVRSGMEAVLSIRSAESCRGWLPVPIVAFTSEDVRQGTALWQECMTSGFNDVAPKPVSKRFATQLLCRWMPGLQQRGLPVAAMHAGSGSEASSGEEVACACSERSASCSKCGSSCGHGASHAAAGAVPAAPSSSGSGGDDAAGPNRSSASSLRR